MIMYMYMCVHACTCSELCMHVAVESWNSTTHLNYNISGLTCWNEQLGFLWLLKNSLSGSLINQPALQEWFLALSNDDHSQAIIYEHIIGLDQWISYRQHVYCMYLYICMCMCNILLPV